MKSRQNDVAELIKKAQDGDEQAVSAIITSHEGLVYSIIFRMVYDHDTSLDLTQETFIKVFLNIGKVNPSKNFKGWICTIARNLTYDYLRMQKRKPTVSLETIGETPGDRGMQKKRQQMIIENALARLEERDRMLLTLCYYKRLSLQEVAEIMGIPERNIRVYMHRARRKLRKELEGHENELLST